MPSNFETELANMDEDTPDIESLLGNGPETENTSARWARPELPLFNSKLSNLEFQQIDVDHYIGTPLFGMPGAQVRFKTWN